MKNKILKLINLKKSEWNRIHNLKKVLMSYDENNKRLKKIIEKNMRIHLLYKSII